MGIQDTQGTVHRTPLFELADAFLRRQPLKLWRGPFCATQPLSFDLGFSPNVKLPCRCGNYAERLLGASDTGERYPGRLCGSRRPSPFSRDF